MSTPASEGSSLASDASIAPVQAASDPNVVPVVLDGGTTGQAFNSPFVTVTVCAPGTGNCQQIDHVLVDTGSFGLRVLASALNGLQLPAVNAPDGKRLAECGLFASGISWGSVHSADVHIGGETAANLPVQLVSDSAIPSAPAACASIAGYFGVGGHANGILGIGVLSQDCGQACAASASPGMYYSCDAGACTASVAPLASQVTNPVSAFGADGNGVMITLPAIPLAGVTAGSGTLTFGIGTRANNQLGSATVYATDAHGGLETTYKGVRYSSFFDTGSNGLFFVDPGMPACAAGNGFYCPAAAQNLSATITSTTGVSNTLNFTVAGLRSVSASAIAAPIAGGTAGMGNVFDWGLPFFFGRTVFVARSGAATSAGAGPYVAF